MPFSSTNLLFPPLTTNIFSKTFSTDSQEPLLVKMSRHDNSGSIGSLTAAIQPKIPTLEVFLDQCKILESHESLVKAGCTVTEEMFQLFVKSEEKVLDDYIPKLSLNIFQQAAFKDGILKLRATP
ncbi:3738_t:CDS:2, partial [Paraglomus brasilianum]